MSDLKPRLDDNIRRAIGYRDNYETQIAIKDLVALEAELDHLRAKLERAENLLQRGLNDGCFANTLKDQVKEALSASALGKAEIEEGVRNDT